MNLNVRNFNTIPVVDLSGRLDAHEAPKLTEALSDLAETTNRTVLDLSNVHFIDSTGLATIVKEAKNYRANGGDITLCGLQKPVKIIFEITHLDKVLSIVDALEEATEHDAQTNEPVGLKVH